MRLKYVHNIIEFNLLNIYKITKYNIRIENQLSTRRWLLLRKLIITTPRDKFCYFIHI